MRISIASDHAGFKYKEKIKIYLLEKGYEIIDHGVFSEESADYPDYIKPAAIDVANNDADKGIGICGSGIGVSIVANKVNGVRAALVLNEQTAALSVQHNNANFLALSQNQTSETDLYKIVDTWLSSTFEGGRHERRVNKIE
ncbi:MAG: ribose 5-phosphate isomerase B [Bacteroidota bacterium]